MNKKRRYKDGIQGNTRLSRSVKEMEIGNEVQITTNKRNDEKKIERAKVKEKAKAVQESQREDIKKEEKVVQESVKRKKIE